MSNISHFSNGNFYHLTSDDNCNPWIIKKGKILVSIINNQKQHLLSKLQVQCVSSTFGQIFIFLSCTGSWLCWWWSRRWTGQTWTWVLNKKGKPWHKAGLLHRFSFHKGHEVQPSCIIQILFRQCRWTYFQYLSTANLHCQNVSHWQIHAACKFSHLS